MRFETSKRLQRLPVYLFAQIEKKMEQKRREGIDIINLGIGDPDLAPPKLIREALAKAQEEPLAHRYSSSAGERFAREGVARWYKTRFRDDVDPETQVCILIGSKEGIANIARAFLNPGEKILVPDPGYPVYGSGAAILCEGEAVSLPLIPERGFTPDLERVQDKAKIMYLNYPNNPTGATVDVEFLKDAAAFAGSKDIILCYDNAYSEMAFDDYLAPSILQVTPNAIEFCSMSKTFNMTGYRIAFAVGHPDLIAGLKKLKAQVDSGPPIFIQKAAIVGLDSYTSPSPPKEVKENIKVYERRRDIMVPALRSMGFELEKPRATFYLWFKVDGKSIEFADRMLDAGVVVTPGVGFGAHGEGYVRIALTQNEERLKEAASRMERALTK